MMEDSFILYGEHVKDMNTLQLTQLILDGKLYNPLTTIRLAYHLNLPLIHVKQRCTVALELKQKNLPKTTLLITAITWVLPLKLSITTKASLPSGMSQHLVKCQMELTSSPPSKRKAIQSWALSSTLKRHLNSGSKGIISTILGKVFRFRSISLNCL
jgi:hypothetical protein